MVFEGNNLLLNEDENIQRRGFLGKFARVVAGAAISAPSILEVGKRVDRFKCPLPKIVKVKDETIIRGEDISSEVVKIVIEAGIRGYYSDIKLESIFRTLFPGLSDNDKIGLKLSGHPVSPLKSQILIEGLVEVLNLFKAQSGEKSGEFLAWDKNASEGCEVNRANNSKGEFNSSPPVQKLTKSDFEYKYEIEGLELLPSPLLTEYCRHQMALIFNNGGGNSKNLCRNAFLSCFKCLQHPDFPLNTGEEVIEKVYSAISYPLCMKFRLFIVERILSENCLYFCGDGWLLDEHLNEPQSLNRGNYKLIEIENPSAPLISGVSLRRKGEDIEVCWRNENYRGQYQIYRSDKSDFLPKKELLIGVSRKNYFTDKGMGRRSNIYYQVTREWGVYNNFNPE